MENEKVETPLFLCLYSYNSLKYKGDEVMTRQDSLKEVKNFHFVSLFLLQPLCSLKK